MQLEKFRSQVGVSLIEIMIILVITGILVTFAVAQFGNSSTHFQRYNIAREFKINLERARFDSVKRRATETTNMARVVINNATSFSVMTDLDQNGILDADDIRQVDFSGRGDVQIAGNDLVFPITILFDQRGHIKVTDGSIPAQTITPYFLFCNGSCTTATVTSANANIIAISATGTINMMSGGETLPTYQNPTVTSVANTDQINPLLAVWIEPTTTPTTSPSPTVSPSPTASPSPSTSPSPSPSSSPSPSPTTSPSPTPAVVACTYGQKPSSTGCTCIAPMWIRQSGKCQ